MKKRRKKHSMKSRAKRIVKGLRLTWDDDNPLQSNSHISCTGVTHSNPILKLDAMKLWNQYKKWICEQQNFLWHISVAVIFSYENGVDQIEEFEMCMNGKVDDVSFHCEENIKTFMRFGAKDKYKTTRFKLTCLGGERPIKKSDYAFSDLSTAQG